MLRAIRVFDPAQTVGRPTVDTVILDHAQRNGQKITVTGMRGGVFEIDLTEPVRLATDDLLELEDGRLVEVVAAAEPLIEARAADLAGLALLAWQLGDRHVPVQILPNRIRVPREAAVEALLVGLGAKFTMLEAPFEPESGAYATSRDHGHGDARGDHGR